MDLLQRAVDMLDRAQSRVTDMTNQAARYMAGVAYMRTLEGRQDELRRQLEQASMDLGKLTFRRWKTGGTGADPAMLALCEQIDRLHAEYQRVAGDLADARAAAAPYPQSLPQGAPPPYPQPYPAAPMSSSYAPPGAPAPPPPYPPPVQTYPPSPSPLPSSMPISPPTPALPPRPLKPVRECPECYTLVPGTTDFCPSCGMRV
jgi:hypothetical protein